MSDTALRAVAPPAELDGGDEMYPLRSAKDAGELLGFSESWMHAAAKSGVIPYVLFYEPPANGRGKGREHRRFRNDHLRQAVIDRTVTP